MSERMNKERAREILKTIRHNSTMQTDYTIDDIDQALDIAIESLQRPKAKWVDKSMNVKCSNCGYERDYYEIADFEKGLPKYCMSCGAEMVVEPYERKE